MRKQLTAAAAALWLAAQPGGTAFAAAEMETGIEQVYVNMPSMYVYGNLPDGQETAVEAYLGEVRLSVAGQEEAGQTGIDYYVLLDVSGSIGDAYFSAVKDGILRLKESLGENERLILYTFGESVTKVLDGSEDSGTAGAALSLLQNTDQKTLLFEAIDQAAKDADSVPAEECTRKVLAVITDGEDVAVGAKTAREAQENLHKKNLPLYAFGIQDTASENITSLGEFARRSGGQMEVFGPQEGGELLTQWRDGLRQFQCIELEAPDNTADSSYKELTLKYPDTGESYSREVYVGRWIPDTEAPRAQVSQNGDRELRVEFSETVEGADQPSGYRLERVLPGKEGEERQAVPILTVTRAEDGGNTYLLTVQEPFQAGQYALSFPGIADGSMEKNPVEAPAALELTGEEAEQSGERENTGRLRWAAAAGGVIVLAAAAALACQKGRGRRKTDIAQDKREAASPAPAPEQMEIRGLPGQVIHCTASFDGRPLQPFDIRINQHLIAGRGSNCDLYFDDSGMSRKHFMISWDGESLLLEDLKSTNGTFVNGKKLTGKYRLEPGDQIKAGTVILMLRW